MCCRETDGSLQHISNSAVLGSLLYYDISDPKTRDSVIQDFIQKEIRGDGASPRAIEAPSQLNSSSSVNVSQSSKQIPNNESDIRAWCADNGIDEGTKQLLFDEKLIFVDQAADYLFAEGFDNAKNLRNLPRHQVNDVKTLLNIKKAALAASLCAALVELFD